MATGKQVVNVMSLLYVVSRYRYIYTLLYEIGELHVIGNTLYDDDEWAKKNDVHVM